MGGVTCDKAAMLQIIVWICWTRDDKVSKIPVAWQSSDTDYYIGHLSSQLEQHPIQGFIKKGAAHCLWFYYS